ETKAQVRQKVFELLTSNNSRLRSAAAAVVASMAVYDWPDEWPQLFSQLTGLLHGGQEQTLSALSVFSEWINGDMSEKQLDHIGLLIPDLHLIFANGNKHSAKARVMAVGVFSDCIEIISNMSTVRREFVDAHVPPILEKWMEPILAILREPVVGGGDQSNIPLKAECIKALVRATVGLQRHLRPYGASILETLWRQIQDLQEPYLHAFVYSESEHSESATNMLVHCSEDGDTQTVDGYLCGIFEWISITAESRSARSLFVAGNKPTSLMRGLTENILCYIQITTEILADWADDLELFVADEEEEGYRFSVRVSAQDLVQALATAFPQALVVSLSDAAQAQSAVASRRRQDQDDSWWLASEAVLCTIDVAASEIKNAAQGGVFDLSNILDIDVWPLAQSPRFPFGQGRAFVFVSSFAQALPPEVATAFVSAAAVAVADPQLHPGVRLSAVRATTKFCRHLPPTQVKPHLGSFIRGLASIIAQLNENSAHIALDALHAALRVDPGVTASLEPLIGEVVMDVWRRYHADVLLNSLVVDIIEDLAANPHARDAFARRALPTIGSAISHADDTIIIASGIDMLCGLIKGMPSPMPEGYTDAIFPSLMRVISISSDSEVQQCGQLCLKSLVQKDAVRLSQWRDEHGTSGLEFIFGFVAELMSPEKSESAALFVGDLACKIAQRCTALVSGETLATLVRTITVRLATARMSSFSASLLPFYAQLSVRHPDAFIDLLSRIDLESRSGLHVVLSAWLANYLDVQGYYSRKVSAVGLMRLFALGDARIKSFMVQGDLISNRANCDKIITRSMSRTNPDQYTTIPAPAKIVKLLLAE
ncbi:ARM repeat-containing protein, partial [Coemansia reversa NRRL 1564]